MFLHKTDNRVYVKLFCSSDMIDGHFEIANDSDLLQTSVGKKKQGDGI